MKEEEKRLMVYLPDSVYQAFQARQLQKLKRINSSGIAADLIAQWVEDNGGLLNETNQ